MKQLDPKVTWLWRAQGLIRLVVFWGPAAAAAGFAASSAGGMAVGSIVAGALILFFLTLALVWPSLQYEYYQYDIREHDLLVQRGVLFRRRSSIPHNRIQHVDTRQGPMERIFGLSRVAVFTAAGMSADGSIPGLLTERAEAIRDELARRGGDDGV
ncbi:MAG: PH domain-containing protein [Proteobacteria bacterium]|nr:PH domain-containing protein [Pseudomonadota bacterium]MCP4916787.1 PH domain-containing protein [Pseudomonadota bacterium]